MVPERGCWGKWFRKVASISSFEVSNNLKPKPGVLCEERTCDGMEQEQVVSKVGRLPTEKLKIAQVKYWRGKNGQVLPEMKAN